MASGPLLIDTDMGFDDIAALALLACNSEPGTIHLVTTVHGMCAADDAAPLARRLLDLLGMDTVPVVTGARYGPSGSDIIAGEDWGLQYRAKLTEVLDALGLGLPDKAVTGERSPEAAAMAAADAILGAAAAAGGVTVLALGSLTNVANAIRRRPDHFR
eukprot:TRINITY_DN78587_c0_g1_i1.p1 TRINITY_DN78587_c0_g1~~TRINITY_DN78587_c0_g1_i1.p1  ORF type:complete len:159 (+),score=25.61 TRINITY_DN78587_c0_g1_i1:127-603(+)